ncbi:hypothetical protein BRN00_06250, partial [Xanthomonas oryzae pv. oryzae]
MRLVGLAGTYAALPAAQVGIDTPSAFHSMAHKSLRSIQTTTAPGDPGAVELPLHSLARICLARTQVRLLPLARSAGVDASTDRTAGIALPIP